MLYRNRLLCFHSGVWLWFVFGWCCVVCFAWLLFVLSSFVCFVSAWWIRGIADEVTIASFCKAVTGTAVMARSANEEKKKKVDIAGPYPCGSKGCVKISYLLDWMQQLYCIRR